MAVTHSRSALLSLRSCWRNSALNIKPLLPSEWNALKSAGMLKRTRGKCSGTKCKADGQRHRIQTVSTPYREVLGAWGSKRRQNSVNYGNLLNIQNVTSSSLLRCETNSVTPSSSIVGRFMIGIPWSSLLTSDKSCEGKLSLLTEVINYGLDIIIPVRSIKIHETDRPWVSTQLNPSSKGLCFWKSAPI